MKRPRALMPWLAAGAVLACLGANADEPVGQVLANQLRFSFSPTGAGARAAGMANAFTAVADDGTAASWNPGGLAQLREPEFSVVFGAVSQKMSMRNFRSPDGLDTYSSFDLSDRNSSLDFASAALPLPIFKKPVTVQVSWQRMYNLNFSTGADIFETALEPGGGLQRFFITQNTGISGDIGLWSIAGAILLTERTALGASLNYWTGDWSVHSAVNETRTSGGPPAPDYLRYDQTNHLTGRNYNLGIMLTYPKFNVGLVYSSPFYADYRFTTVVRSNIESPVVGANYDQTELRFPKRVALGVAWHPTDAWTVDLDLAYNQWKRMVIVGVPYEFPTTNFLDLKPEDLTATRNTVSGSVGAEYLFIRDKFVIPLRFGLGVDPQGGMDPDLRDPVTYYVASIGTGFNTNSLKFDAAFQYRWASYRTGEFMEPKGMVSVPRTPDAYGDVNASEWRLYLSGIYRVTSSEGLGKVLHKVFVGP